MIAQNYTLPDRNYLREQLESLRAEFHEFEQSIAGGQDCFCVDNEPPPEVEAPADNGCDCDPCNCPTDRHPCYAGSEFNNGDGSTAGLRGALERLMRQARELQAAQDDGTTWAECGCGRGARAGAGTEARAEARGGGEPRDEDLSQKKSQDQSHAQSEGQSEGQSRRV